MFCNYSVLEDAAATGILGADHDSVYDDDGGPNEAFVKTEPLKAEPLDNDEEQKNDTVVNLKGKGQCKRKKGVSDLLTTPISSTP